MFGWKGDSLQRAMNARCNGAVCGELKTQSSEDAMKCTKSAVVEDDVDGCMSLHRHVVTRFFHANHILGVTEIPGMRVV